MEKEEDFLTRKGDLEFVGEAREWLHGKHITITGTVDFYDILRSEESFQKLIDNGVITVRAIL